MADEETKNWAKKTRQIEEERLKAMRASIEEEKKFDKVNLAYLDPRQVKIKGWSVDRHLLLKKTEKLGTWSAILVPIGVVMELIAEVGAIVTEMNNLGLAGVMISGLPAAVSGICLGLSAVFIPLIMGVELYCKIRDRRKFGMGWWSAMGAAAVLILCILLRLIAL